MRSWLDTDSEEDLPAIPPSKSKKMSTNKVKKQVDEEIAVNPKILMGNCELYFVNKPDVLDKVHTINYKDSPENMVTQIVQAKYVIYDNKYKKDKS